MPPVRVLANLPLPQPEGFVLRHFGVYAGQAFGQASGAIERQAPWQPRQERRSLKEILARIPAAEQPEILLIRSPEYLPLPLDITEFKGLKILIATDWNVSLRYLPDLCGLFDWCFTDAAGAGLLRRAGVANIWPAAIYGHDARTVRNQHLRRDLDLSFCGNLNAGLHRERNRILPRLLPLREKFKLHLAPAFGAAYSEILSRSRVVFNFSVRGEANMRLYEAMACGAVPVIERGNVEAPLYFEEGKHYAVYDPADPAVGIEALLREPERLIAMGHEAQKAVQEHTQEKQLERMLRQALEDPASRYGGPLSPTARPAPHPKRAVQAAQTLRVLGTGYTLRESIEEIRAATAHDPEYRLMVFPGLLLSLLDKTFAQGAHAQGANTQEARGAQETRSAAELPSTLLQWVEQMLAEPEMPRLIAAWHRLSLAAAGGRAESVLAAAEALGLEAQSAEGAPFMFAPWHLHVLAPADLAKPLNADLNAIFRQDLERGPGGFKAFALAMAIWHKAQALMKLQRVEAAQAEAAALPAGYYASLDVYALRADLALRLNAKEDLVAICRAWHADNPLDARVWDAIMSKLMASGDRTSLRAFLADWLRLAQAFFRDGIPAGLAKLADEFDVRMGSGSSAG